MNSEESDQSAAGTSDVGFTWWEVWAWLGLTLGNLLLLSVGDPAALAAFLIILNTVLMVMILRYNKHAFLIATVLSLNPLLWIINGFYLKRRWHHPKVNVAAAEPAPPAGTICDSVEQSIAPEAAQLSPHFLDGDPFAISPSDEEDIYERAANEIGSDALRKGLWAKSLAEADGNEAVAKARYVRARSQQLLQEYRNRLIQQREQEKRADATRKAQFDDEEKVCESGTQGACPNCEKAIPLSADKCDGCGAVFIGTDTWKPMPR